MIGWWNDWSYTKNNDWWLMMVLMLLGWWIFVLLLLFRFCFTYVGTCLLRLVFLLFQLLVERCVMMLLIIRYGGLRKKCWKYTPTNHSLRNAYERIWWVLFCVCILLTALFRTLLWVRFCFLFGTVFGRECYYFIVSIWKTNTSMKKTKSIYSQLLSNANKTFPAKCWQHFVTFGFQFV